VSVTSYQRACPISSLPARFLDDAALLLAPLPRRILPSSFGELPTFFPLFLSYQTFCSSGLALLAILLIFLLFSSPYRSTNVWSLFSCFPRV
jgi:hypothetical protein